MQAPHRHPDRVSGSDLPVLLILSSSTRPGRKSSALAAWLAQLATERAEFSPDLVELADLALPLLDEPHHPRLGRYEHEHTRAWSRRVAAASAIVIVTPEYNHSFPAGVKNALDYLNAEWAGKPLGYLTYGGVSAGTRAMAALQPVVAILGMRPVPVAVNVPFVGQVVGEDGSVSANETMIAAGNQMLAGLAAAVAERQRLLDHANEAAFAGD